jgi:D-lactate dehydrogenase (cytochrome)
MNKIKAIKAGNSILPDILEATRVASDFLHDESRMQGRADFISFPSSTEEFSGLMRWANEKGLDVTLSGGRTGIAGGAVPEGGLLASSSRMSKIFGLEEDAAGNISARVQAGVLLSELRSYLEREKNKYFFPPDPTETSANIGGMIACNASGAHSFHYGPTRNYVKALSVVLANGDILNIKRGECFADESDNSFEIELTDGNSVKVFAPLFERPSTKNAAGYYSGKGIDLIDVFIGSEGTLGVVTEAELVLLPRPEREFNAMFFLENERTAIELTETLRRSEALEISAIEYFDHAALGLLRKRREEIGAASAVPPGMPEDKNVVGIYIDVSTDAEKVASDASELKNISGTLKSGSVSAVWAAFDKDERERLRKFRHALPETVNSIISERRKNYPEITKLGTDMAVPDEYLSEILNIYRSKLDEKSLQYVIFGHIGDNHVHVNILPANMDEYLLGKKLYAEFAAEVLRMKGSVSAEHGIGKLKKNFLSMMLGKDGIGEMAKLKKALDPGARLGKGTLFLDESG